MAYRARGVWSRYGLGGLFLFLAVAALTGCSGEAPKTNIGSSDQGKKPAADTPEPRVVTPANIDTPPADELPIASIPEKPIDEKPVVSGPIATGPVVRPALPVAESLPTPLGEPHVILSQQHEETCRVGVGDPMPAISLRHLNGKDFQLSQLYGQRMTVVLFWTANHPFALEQFERLSHEVDGPYSKYGVEVVAINVGDSQQAVSDLNLKIAGNYSSLLDPQGEALGQVATNKLPRTYLLDAEGKILWFDIEYSLSTARELKNALHYHLKTVN